MYCKNICALIAVLELNQKTTECIMVVNSPNISLKAVLLHNGKIIPSATVFYISIVKKTYENMKIL